MCTFAQAYKTTLILKESIPKSSITWSEMGKQNIQAKKVYCCGSASKVTISDDLSLSAMKV